MKKFPECDRIRSDDCSLDCPFIMTPHNEDELALTMAVHSKIRKLKKKKKPVMIPGVRRGI